MDQHFPVYQADVDPLVLVPNDPRPAPATRPWVLVNMVASIDGAIEVDGRSGGLGSRADKAMFHALRELPDLIFAGAGTVRAENYGPVQLDDAAKARRVARGQQPIPRIAVVTKSARLDPNAKLFSDPMQRPIIITSNTGHRDAPDQLHRVADFVVAGEVDVNLPSAFAQLRESGITTMLCEGGPTLNNQLLADDLVDEWCQTIAPLLTGGDAARGAYGPGVGATRTLDLVRVLSEESVLLLRYARKS